MSAIWRAAAAKPVVSVVSGTPPRDRRNLRWLLQGLRMRLINAHLLERLDGIATRPRSCGLGLPDTLRSQLRGQASLQRPSGTFGLGQRQRQRYLDRHLRLHCFCRRRRSATCPRSGAQRQQNLLPRLCQARRLATVVTSGVVAQYLWTMM